MCDLVLLMTVNPGFGGQKFMPEVLEKIQLTRQFCDQYQKREKGAPPFSIQVDGGINVETGRQCIEAGADVLVSGEFLYRQPSLAQGIESLRNCL